MCIDNYATSFSFDTGSSPVSLLSGDFNNDKKQDLAVIVQDDNAIGILLGHGNGSFRSQLTQMTNSTPSSFASADFNRDGNLDIAFTSINENSVDIQVG